MPPEKQRFAPKIAHCGFCEALCLYVDIRSVSGGHARWIGEILNLEPQPKGKYHDRGDGIYIMGAQDGTGHAPHRCRTREHGRNKNRRAA